ncbi:BF3164 family lipoprotein [Roseivirga pacifica]|nr:BF3164 family lipoprotein [Roseivirga pacifica]
MAISSRHTFILNKAPYESIKVYSTDSLRYLGSFGYEGQGPGDFEFYRLNGSGFNLGNNGKTLLVQDYKYLRTIPINDIENKLANNNLAIEYKFTIPGSLIPFNDVYLIGSTHFLGKVGFSPKHFKEFLPVQASISDVIDYPKRVNYIPKEANHHLYWSHFDTSIDAKHGVLAYMRFPMVRIFDIESQKSKYIEFQPKNKQIENIKVAGNGKSVDNSKMFSYYFNVEVSDNRIYALYQESILIRDSGTGKLSYKSEQPPALHVYDWNGNPVMKITMPTWMGIYNVSPDDSLLYFMHPEKDSLVYKINLNQLNEHQ